MNLPGVLVELPTFTEKDIEGNIHVIVEDDNAAAAAVLYSFCTRKSMTCLTHIFLNS